MGVYNILQKTDQALVAFIVQSGAGTITDVLPGKASLKMTLPVTVCESRTAKPALDNPVKGIYEVESCIYVRTQGSGEPTDNEAGTPAQDSGDRVAATFDAFHPASDQAGDVLADLINAAAGAQDFTVQSAVVTEMRAGFESKGDAWTDILDLRLIVVAATGV